MRFTIAEAPPMSDVESAALLPVLRLKRNEDRRLHAGHLWIFSNEVDTQQSPLNKFKPGDLARVQAHNDKSLGLAYVNPQSLICARVLQTWTVPTVDWLITRLRSALALRERLYAKPYYRLAYGESDGLPGLVVDRYGDTCVVQIGTAGMERLKPQIQSALSKLLKCKVLMFKNDSGAREMEGLPSYVETPLGEAAALSRVQEDDLNFQVPLAEGQKTGWFFDQSANRRALVKYVRPKAKVLDVCSYVGAWGIRALSAGATDVCCIDSSASALELASANAAANGGTLRTLKGDAFDAMEKLAKQNEKFDVVIIDPPAFAKRKKDLPKALAAYKRLNQLAMQLIDDGILVSCSCSYHVSAEELQQTIAKAARGAEKQVQILESGGQAPDHPVHPAIPETRYLKAYFCHVADGLK
jgi:23S rRNA (cytosine1962-C5)-methyltransferase